MLRLFLWIIVITAAALAPVAHALDVHRYWDTTCGECHGHSADFARRFLSVKDGDLQGRHHVTDLRKFLANHYASADMTEPVYRMLLAQRQTAPLFRSKCGGCHRTAAEFAREFLEMRDGVLVGRETGKPVAEFLKGHGRLSPADQKVMLGVLTRVEGEVRGGTR